MADHTQTGSISFEAVGGFSSYASGQFTTTEDVAQMSQPNLSPFFSHPLSDIYNAETNPDGYWSNNLTGGSSPLTDGWNHYEFSNTASDTRWLTIYEHCAWRHANGDLKGDTEYTVLMEFRNVAKTGNVTASGITTHSFSWSSMFRTTPAAQAVAEGATLYFTSKTVTDPSAITGNSTSTRTLLNIPAGASISCDIRVSLYEGEYEGPYKPYVDQSLITRVSTAETAIEQNAEAITLRATKSVVSQSVRNLLSGTAQPTIKNESYSTHASEIAGSTIIYKWSGGTLSKVSGAVRMDFTGVNQGLVVPLIAENCVTTGERVTLSLTYRANISASFSTWFLNRPAPNSNNGNAITTIGDGEWHEASVSFNVTLSSGAAYSMLLFYGGGTATDKWVEIKDGTLFLERGDTRYASQAQLKVANDEIDLRVEKSGVIAAINASTEAEGGSAVKISADKVNIEGAAIFTSGRLSQSSLNDAYDAKGAASAVQDNLDNLQVGGRNLLRRTATPFSYAINTTNYGTHHLYSTGSTDTAYDGPMLSDFGLAVGDEVTFTFDWETSQNGSAAIRYGNFRVEYYGVTSSGTNGYITAMAGGVVTMNESNASGRFSRTATLTAATIKTQRMVLRIDNSALVFTVSNAKLERGNKPTDWTPAPEDVTSRTQRIYYRSDSATKPATPSAWVTKEDDGTGAWTKMHVAITSTHKYIYTCEQSEMANGTLGCTAVLRDNTITVIDGSNVITHSIVADKLDADSVKANIVKTTELDATKITSGDIATERMSANIVSAVKAKVSDLYALVAKIGGFIIDATSIRTAALTSNADNSIGLSTADFTRTVNGTSRSGLRLAMGDKFGVTGDGTLYANGANITSINAGNISSGSISADRIKANVISAVNNGTGTINADKVNVSAIKIGDLDGASTVVSNAANGKSAYDRHTAYRGTCSTAAGTAAKVVACTGFALATGATVEVYCSTANTANVPTLNINSTGAKPIWINGAVASASNPCKWLAGDTVTFTYDGTRFRASLPVEGYVTEGTGGGLMVHRKSDATTGVQITDDVDIVRDGVSVALFGTDENNQPISRVGLANAGHTEQKSGSFDIYVKDETTQDILKAVSIHSRTSSGTLNTLEFYAEQNNSIAIDAEDFPDDDVMGPQLYIDTYSATPNRITGVAIQASAITAGSEYKSARIYVNVQQDGTRDITFSADTIWFSNDNVIQGDAIASLPASKLTGTIADSNLPTKDSAGTAGTSEATSGATLAVPYVTTDAYGRVTAKGTHTHTIGSLAASAVTTGTFNAARIPNLNASKITAGTLNSARLPTVPINKGGTGQTGVEKTTDIAAVMSAASGVTISAAQVATWGKVMQVLITAKATAAKSGTWTVGTMTAGHRPELVTFGTSNLAAIEQCRMGTDGAVSVAGTLAANASVSLTFTYLLA